MDGQVQQPNEGEVKNPGEVKAETQPQVEAQPTEQPKTVENPATENKTDGEAQGKKEPKAEPKNDDPKGKEEPAREMTAEQFELYNETLRRVSKTAKASLPERYNAFEDTEVKTLLKSLLRRKFKDKDLLWLLDDIVDSYDNGNPKGIPIGSYTSQYFGNFYLSYFDHWAKEEKRIKYLLRYMDDIVILSDSKEYLHRLRAEIADYLASNLALKVKENWQVFPTTVRGIDFVGYRYFGDFTLLRTSTKRRLKKAAKRLRRKVERGKALTLPNRSTVGSYNGILEWCDSTRLKEKTINKFIGGKYGNSKRKSGSKAA